MVASLFAPGNRNAAKHAALTTVPPWYGWPKMSRHAQAIRFIETYCRPAKGVGHGAPLRLATFQREFLEQALADGTDAAVLTTPRGNGKSTFGGALAVWAGFADEETGAPQVPVIATTIRQAELSCYGAAAAMVAAEPELARRAVVYTGIGMKKIAIAYNGGEIFPISNDPDGLQGLDFSLALADEIGFQGIESWDSLRMASGKRSRSLIVGVGTPGLDRDNALWHLRSIVKGGGEMPGFFYREYTAPAECAIDDRQAWREANPALTEGFLRESAIETDLALAPESHFRLFRLNQWVDGTDAWLGADGRKTWTALEQPYVWNTTEPTFLGTDIGIKHDSSAVVAVQRDTDGMLHAVSRAWLPTPDQAVDVTDVMQHVRDLAAKWNVVAVSFDPRYFDVPAKMLADSGLPMVEVPQSPERMTPIIGNLYELIKRGLLRHDGDPVLTTHVLNAVPRYNERGFTLQKSKARGKIDACIALALAVDEALHFVPEPAKPKPWVMFG